LWFSQPVLLALGQDPEVAGLAQSYLRIAQWGMFPALGLMAIRSFVTGLEKGGIVLCVTISMFLINAFLAYSLIFGEFGAPAFGLKGAAMAAVIANLLGFLLAAAYVEIEPRMRTFEIFVRFWRPDWGMLREITVLGLPICFTILAEA